MARHNLVLGVILTGLALVALPALAQSPTPSAALRAACADDVRTHCAGVQRGGGRIMQCMKENSAKLSEACRNALAQAQSKK
jgi:hypothetical protein